MSGRIRLPVEGASEEPLPFFQREVVTGFWTRGSRRAFPRGWDDLKDHEWLDGVLFCFDETRGHVIPLARIMTEGEPARKLTPEALAAAEAALLRIDLRKSENRPQLVIAVQTPPELSEDDLAAAEAAMLEVAQTVGTFVS